MCVCRMPSEIVLAGEVVPADCELSAPGQTLRRKLSLVGCSVLSGRKGARA